MSDELTDDVISQWLEVAAPCLFAAWQYGQTPDDADPVAWFAEVYGQGAPGPVHAVHVIGDDGRTVAVTGNGPRSAAHAKFLAWSSPGNVSKLLCDFRSMRTRALAAERLLADERAAHAETLCELDALLTALGAQVTPGGQTLESCHARRVADGLRLAKRAAKSAPAKCSCTHEAGDSWCLAHPTCAECGAFTPSCVDACADHVKPAPAVPARREVPADVEAAIVSLVAAARDATNYEPDRTTVAKHLTAERLVKEAIADIRAAIAKAIADAEERARADSPSAPQDVEAAIAEVRVHMEHSHRCDKVEMDSLYGSGYRGAPGEDDECNCHVSRSVTTLRTAIAAEIERARAEGWAESPAAPATVARPISEWHDDIGSALWWRFPVEEPPYSGSPLDSDWPGYHTHWTPIVCPDEPHSEADADPASRGPIGGGS